MKEFMGKDMITLLNDVLYWHYDIPYENTGLVRMAQAAPALHSLQQTLSYIRVG